MRQQAAALLAAVLLAAVAAPAWAQTGEGFGGDAPQVSAVSDGPAGDVPVNAFVHGLGADALEAAALETLGNPLKFEYAMRHALYKLPEGDVKGTCVFVHGCKHDPESWFYHSSSCPRCTGLPEEVAHTKQCLARGYAVLALASRNREYQRRCFSSNGNYGSDQASSRAAVKSFVAKHGLQGKPIYMWGISSGGSFVVKFPNEEVPIQGIVSEVNMPWEYSWGVTDGEGMFQNNTIWPPTAYYWMANDDQTRRQIEKALEIFKKNGVRADAVFSPPWRIHPYFFSDRSMYISRAQSAAIVAALQKIGALYDTGYLRYDPRENRTWTQVLPTMLPWLRRESPYFNVVSDESQVWQILNFAYSQHEIVGEYARPTLMWLESKGLTDLNALVKQYNIHGKMSCLTQEAEGPVSPWCSDSGRGSSSGSGGSVATPSMAM